MLVIASGEVARLKTYVSWRLSVVARDGLGGHYTISIPILGVSLWPKLALSAQYECPGKFVASL